jgi:hypothetical protein
MLANRLPEGYDCGRIRALTKERGPIWDARPELYGVIGRLVLVVPEGREEGSP